MELEEESVGKTVSLNFGSKLTRNEVYPVIRGERSVAWLIGSNIVTSSQHVDNFTCIEHVAPNCESHELYKGLYGAESKGIFTGTIIVREEAQKTNAYQSNGSLICSDDAESISRPQLKIWADDVKCSHGATVGQLDDEALFYLRARGISEVEARSILTKAYVADVLDHIEDEKLKDNILEVITNKLVSVL
jgi:Fe-S cluster assembly protein SufD